MPRVYRLLSRIYEWDRYARGNWPKVLLLVGILAVCWSVGLVDFIRERDFRQFEWPPFVNVREQIVRELLGQPAEFLHYNRWADVRHLATPSCHRNWLSRRKSLLIIAKTAPERIERRAAYRKTLSAVKQVGGFRIKTIFVTGIAVDFAGSQLEEEATEHEDLLVGDFKDDYFNNTLKYLNSLKWARWHCFPSSTNIPFLLLMDDDYMLNVNNLVALLERTPPNEQLYTGWRIDSSPFRLRFQKFHLSIDEYPFAQFPPYISAGCVLYSPQAVREFYAAVQFVKIFRFDDIYASIIAYYLGYEARMDRNFLFKRDDSVSWTTKVSEHGWSATEIVASFGWINSVHN